MPATGWRDDSPKLPDMEKVNAAMDRHRKERELRDAVVEAAKKWEQVSDAGGEWNVMAAMATLGKTTRALLKFEEQQK